ncbi:MAG: glycosyltransferase [Candidatus Eisenbacteria bacterium]|nr:glycosyltransferase [Candidatus Eisenbacteria bacterium]
MEHATAVGEHEGSTKRRRYEPTSGRRLRAAPPPRDVCVFGENLSYRYGGAERSTHLLARQLESLVGLKVRGVSGSWKHLESSLEKYPYETLDEIPCLFTRRLPYLRYLLNLPRIRRYFRNCGASVLLANNKAGAIAVNAFRGPSVFFIHDESNLNVRRDYRRDPGSRLRFAVQCILDSPFFALFSIMNRMAMRKAAIVVANSRYMGIRAQRKFGVKPVVVYPQVDVRGLSQIDTRPPEERPYILMVGHEELKGVSVFKRLAELMPEHEFMLVGRTFEGERREGNITYRGFVKDPVELYRHAKLVLMPSQCEEGFGMVSLEASALGVPSIVSFRGGLPETVAHDDCIVFDYDNPLAWADTIDRVLADYGRFSRAARSHASRFDMRRQLETLLRELERANVGDRAAAGRRSPPAAAPATRRLRPIARRAPRTVPVIEPAASSDAQPAG